MNNTEHFKLLTYGPDDIVNVMTVDKSNMETIDAALQKNLIQGISKATELKTDTVHALTRFDEDCPIFRFTSTTNFVAGETFVVDGQQVTALTPAGSSLATGAYVIGSEVLCILRDTRLTIFVSGASTADDALKLGGELPEFYAKQEDMDSVTATANAAGSLAQSNLTKINEMNERLTQLIHKKTITVNITNGADYVQTGLNKNDIPVSVELVGYNAGSDLKVNFGFIRHNGTTLLKFNNASGSAIGSRNVILYYITIE